MPSIANDGTLQRGSIDLTINGTVYALFDFKRSAKARTELDYDSSGRPAAASHVEDFETITGTIRARSDKPAPPKFIVFAHDGKNWYIKDSELSGSAPGLKEFAVEIIECISGTVVVT